MCAPRIVGHCRGFAWRRLPVSIRCSAARRRPQYEIIITRKVTQWKDVSHAAVVVDEDKIKFVLTFNIKWLQVASWKCQC